MSQQKFEILTNIVDAFSMNPLFYRPHLALTLAPLKPERILQLASMAQSLRRAAEAVDLPHL